MATTAIEWCTVVWNALLGCAKVSPGCDNCYALLMSLRQAGMARKALRERGGEGRGVGRRKAYLDVVANGDWNDVIRAVPEALAAPLSWGKPETVFVNSMSDLFHKNAPGDFVERICRVMARADWHTYQVLTKRSSLMRNLLGGRLRFAAELPHVWWGVSVEDREHGLPRIEHLRQAPAAVRFLSVEPLLEDLGEIDLRGIHWVIVGGESGSAARPVKKEWVLSIRDQCAAAKVPFFFKQWGGRKKKQNGRLLEGRTHDEMPLCVRNPVPGRQQRLAWAAEFAPETPLIQLGLINQPQPPERAGADPACG
jgi:protein gp37